MDVGVFWDCGTMDAQLRGDGVASTGCPARDADVEMGFDNEGEEEPENIDVPGVAVL